tara:strand:- start:18829 stop:19416 length:588 start_codon:yes stop_codon:yes gene_type:complete
MNNTKSSLKLLLEYIEKDIRQKNNEYSNALREKIKKYGFYSLRFKKYVLSEEYYIACPKNWNENKMGKWSNNALKHKTYADPIVVSSDEDLHNSSEYSSDEYPEAPILHRTERLQRITQFNNYYKKGLYNLTNAHKTLIRIHKNVYNLNNTLFVIKNVIKQNNHYARLGKCEVVKNILDYIGKNNYNYNRIVNCM